MLVFKSKMTVNSGPCRLHAGCVDRIWGRMDERMAGQPGEKGNAWSLGGMVIPCRWRAGRRRRGQCRLWDEVGTAICVQLPAWRRRVRDALAVEGPVLVRMRR